MTTEINSPIPTSRAVKRKVVIFALLPSARKNVSSAQIITALHMTGMSDEISGYPFTFTLRRTLVSTAASSVAKVPIRMSAIPYGLARFEMAQPIARPGMAAGVNTGRIQRISESRTCMGPNASPMAFEMSVSTK